MWRRNKSIEKVSRLHVYFVFFVLGSLIAFQSAIKQLISFSLTKDYGSHILLVLPISAIVIYLKRIDIGSSAPTGPVPVGRVFLVGTALACLLHSYSWSHTNNLSFEIAELILLWIVGFVSNYGISAFRAARFPLMFLFLMIPMPDFLIDKITFGLQAMSAAVAYGLFRGLNVPVFKDGFVFLLPGTSIQVARECSGIRSSVVLLITALLAGGFALRSSWSRTLLVFSTLPILILKNGIRIVVICLLSIYLDPRFMRGWLHTSGGGLFYGLGVLALIPIFRVLRRREEGTKDIAFREGPARKEGISPVPYNVATACNRLQKVSVLTCSKDSVR